jgi:hypothetical protein
MNEFSTFTHLITFQLSIGAEHWGNSIRCAHALLGLCCSNKSTFYSFNCVPVDHLCNSIHCARARNEFFHVFSRLLHSS